MGQIVPLHRGSAVMAAQSSAEKGIGLQLEGGDPDRRVWYSYSVPGGLELREMPGKLSHFPGSGCHPCWRKR